MQHCAMRTLASASAIMAPLAGSTPNLGCPSQPNWDNKAAQSAGIFNLVSRYVQGVENCTACTPESDPKHYGMSILAGAPAPGLRNTLRATWRILAALSVKCSERAHASINVAAMEPATWASAIVTLAGMQRLLAGHGAVKAPCSVWYLAAYLVSVQHAAPDWWAFMPRVVLLPTDGLQYLCQAVVQSKLDSSMAHTSGGLFSGMDKTALACEKEPLLLKAAQNPGYNDTPAAQLWCKPFLGPRPHDCAL
jgi:hypothetical protein